MGHRCFPGWVAGKVLLQGLKAIFFGGLDVGPKGPTHNDLAAYEGRANVRLR
jgi:hypothetical protein